MKEKLEKIINSIITLNEKELDAVSSVFELQTISPKHLLTKIGDVENRLYFLVSGVLRLYCLNTKDEETTIFLFSENSFASCYSSFLTGSPSDQALESIEACELLCINRDDFNHLHQQVPKMNVLTRIVAEQRFINSQLIFTKHITHTPEEHYLDFERTQGQLMLRVPQHILASFLGVTPVSLSRIRKRVAFK